MKIKIVVFLSLISVSLLFSQEITTPKQIVSIQSTETNQNEDFHDIKDELVGDSKNVLDVEFVSALRTENNELKLQNEKLSKALEISNQSFDRATNTYNWLLGIILTLAGIVLGGNIIYQKIDRNSIMKSIKKELDEKYENQNKDSKQLIKDEYTNKVNEIKKEIENDYNQKFIILSGGMTNKVNKALKEIKEINLKLLKNKFNDEKKKSPRLAISTAVDIILILIELYGDVDDHLSDHVFTEYLVYIIKMQKKGVKFFTIDSNSVNEMLEKLPPRFESQKKELEAIIAYEDPAADVDFDDYEDEEDSEVDDE